MAIAVVMPRQGQSVESCVITKWHKSKGESVNKGDLLFSYETDKAAFDEEASEDGVLLEVFFQAGDEVPVLENVAIIGQTGDNYSDLIPSVLSGQPGKFTEKKAPGNKEANTGIAIDSEKGTKVKPVNSRARISPLARKIARELDLTVTGIKGTGPMGRIIERDVLEAAAKIKDNTQKTSSIHLSGETGYTVKKLTSIRKIIAGKMLQSLQNSAQLTHHMSADARKILAWRKEIKLEKKGKPGFDDISINDMVCYALIKALKKHPFMNTHFMGDSIRVFNKVHLGIAVDTERGLMVPALRNADDFNIGGLAERIRSLAVECRKGSVDPELLSSEYASFTVTNLGIYGVEMFTPVLNLPQTGIMGVNTITYRPADMGDGVIGFVPMIGISLTYDHRAVDGAPASVFLAEVKKEIENIDKFKVQAS